MGEKALLNRRQVASLPLALTPLAGAVTATAASEPGAPRILRYAFLIAESGFDPAQITDLYSRTLASGLFEAPLEFVFMAQPARMRPNTAAAMPEVSDDYRTFTFRIRPGIFFADDPAFKGQRRELVAEDYVYSIKRHYDPRWKSGNLYLLENAKILGLSELRQRLMVAGKPFDYDTPVEGLRALDRYTFQLRLAEPAPRILYNFADGSFLGALAREVVEFYGDRISEHPVGTGPFVLKSWRRSSRIVLARNPNYREVRWDETPPEGNTRLAAAAEQLRGRRLPLLDEVHIAIIEEAQPRWLSFLNGEQDLMDQLPADFAPTVIPNNRLAPHLAKRGLGMVRYPRVDVAMSYFAMEHPVVGGYAPHKVALRRAIALAVDVEREIRLVRRGQAVPAQGPIPPHTFGHVPTLKTEMSDHSVARARALLDMHGYVDSNRDGWREQPDGSPLVLEYATSPDQQSRQLNEQWQRNMDAIGIRIEFKVAKWPENLRASRAGKLMMWGLGWSGSSPDGDTFLGLAYGPNKGQSNHSRFDLPAFNKLYERQQRMPDGPERLAVMTEAQKLLVAYMPLKIHVHRVFTDLAHPWVVGYHRNPFVREFYKYVDVDPAELARRGAASA
jgi:ABC-type transport system substrate-binding protein